MNYFQFKQDVIRREKFDPTNQDHLDSLISFIRTGNWGSIQFYVEAPFTNVPMSVLTAYARHSLSVTAESPAERTERLAQNTKLLRLRDLPSPEEQQKKRLEQRSKTNQTLAERITALHKSLARRRRKLF